MCKGFLATLVNEAADWSASVGSKFSPGARQYFRNFLLLFLSNESRPCQFQRNISLLKFFFKRNTGDCQSEASSVIGKLMKTGEEQMSRRTNKDVVGRALLGRT